MSLGAIDWATGIAREDFGLQPPPREIIREQTRRERREQGLPERVAIVVRVS